MKQSPMIKMDKVNFMTTSGSTVRIGATSWLGDPIRWSSDNARVATADNHGNVTRMPMEMQSLRLRAVRRVHPVV